MSPRRASARQVVAAVAALDAGFVGIDGYGASGKTTLAAAVAAAVPHAVVVHIDDFAAPAIAEWDWDRFRAQVLLPLLAGRPARYQRWDWATDSGAEWHNIEPGSLVVVEGVSATRREVGAPWALTVWVDAPLDVRLQRALARDGATMLPRWLEQWIPSEQAYVAEQDPLARVDLVVDGVSAR